MKCLVLRYYVNSVHGLQLIEITLMRHHLVSCSSFLCLHALTQLSVFCYTYSPEYTRIRVARSGTIISDKILLFPLIRLPSIYSDLIQLIYEHAVVIKLSVVKYINFYTIKLN